MATPGKRYSFSPKQEIFEKDVTIVGFDQISGKQIYIIGTIKER